MVHGIGIDLVEIPRMARIIKRRQERFLRRVFTPGEIAYCRSKVAPEIHYSARFAAKEAFLKSIGVGLAEGIRLADIEVQKSPQAPPILQLHGKAQELLARQGIVSWHVSLSHTGDYATAVVILEK